VYLKSFRLVSSLSESGTEHKAEEVSAQLAMARLGRQQLLMLLKCDGKFIFVLCRY
jgi:hypothetical protein